MPAEKKKIEYKGLPAELVMMGKRSTVPGYRGELFVVIIRYGTKELPKYDILPDSTSPADLDDLPPVETFDSLSEAMTRALHMDKTKNTWKQAKEDKGG